MTKRTKTLPNAMLGLLAPCSIVALRSQMREIRDGWLVR